MNTSTLKEFCSVIAPLWREAWVSKSFYVPPEISVPWASVNLLGLGSGKYDSILNARFSSTMVQGWAFDASSNASIYEGAGALCFDGNLCILKLITWHGAAIDRARCPTVGGIVVLADASGRVRPNLADVVASTAAKLVAYGMVESAR